MTGLPPALLFDTCAIINLSYCTPVAALVRSRYEGKAGWVRATHAELVRQRGRRPPHPQAGRASNWALDHLGEAASIALLESAGTGRLITDDHGARAESRKRGVKASSTVGVIAQLLTVQGSGVDRVMADTYLQTLHTRERMHIRLTSIDLLAGDLGPWQ